jgi:hypothetical protein
MNRLLTAVMSTFLVLVTLPDVLAQEDSWPRTLPLDQGTMTIYPLQVDSKNGDIIQFRAALAYRETPDAEPVFGAGWFESRVEIDTASQVVHPGNLKVTQTRFPAGTDDVQAELEKVLANEASSWNLDFTVAELQAALNQAEAESLAVQNLNTAPPKIVYRDHPALLVSLDGDPVLREIENSEYKAVINTPYPLIYDGKSYYLNAAKDVWYRAGKATGPYQFDANPPASIAVLVQPDEEETAEATATEVVTAANAPEIVVSTEPAELIVTEGPAAFVPLVDDLLVLQNSDDDVFMHVGSQQYYVPLAGRWYHSKSLNGPWEYQAADTLPAAFAKIPKNSDQADSRVYVAGTEEAREAVLDAQVPKTAAVARGEVDIDVQYDGNPDFDEVDGTDMQFAKNTGSTVIESNGLYYLVEDGVWYVSAYPDGPWQVADYRPQQVASIMPTSPVYNVKYVYVYDSTPDVVYVGYTPGYLGSYVYYDTIFYGSGWNYRPWVSPYYYYPRFSTFGWNVRYDSWYGWSFGFGWAWGPFSASYYPGGYWHNNHYWHNRYYSYWGPRGYRPHHYARNDYRRHGRGDYAHRGRGHGDRGYGDDDRYGSDRGDRGAGYRQRDDNLYRDGRQRALIADSRDTARRTPGDGRSSDGPNRMGYTAPDSANGKKSANKGRRGDRVEPVSSRNLNVQSGVQDQPGAGMNPAGRNRTEPVTASELGNKARNRDREFAGKSGKSRDQTEPVRAADLSNKARLRDQQSSDRKTTDQNRIEPVRASDLSNKAQRRDRNDSGRKSQGVDRTEPARIADSSYKAGSNDRKNSGKNSGSRSRTEPVQNSRLIAENPEQVSQRKVQEPSSRSRSEPGDTPVNKSRNRAKPAPDRNKPDSRIADQPVARKGRNGQSGVTTSEAPQRTARNDNAPIPLPQYRTRNDNAPQRSERVATGRDSAPRQAASQPVAARQPAPSSKRGNSAPVRNAPQSGGFQSRGQRSQSTADGGNRRGSTRDKG